MPQRGHFGTKRRGESFDRIRSGRYKASVADKKNAGWPSAFVKSAREMAAPLVTQLRCLVTRLPGVYLERNTRACSISIRRRGRWWQAARLQMRMLSASGRATAAMPVPSIPPTFPKTNKAFIKD